MIESVLRRALRCRACGSDWEGARCKYCGHDEFVDVIRFYPGFDGPAKGIMIVAAGQRAGAEGRGYSAEVPDEAARRGVRRHAPAYHG